MCQVIAVSQRGGSGKASLGIVSPIYQQCRSPFVNLTTTTTKTYSLKITAASPRSFKKHSSMALTRPLLLVCLVIALLALSTPATAFGAGNIASIAKVEGHNWRHGDIEDLSDLLISAKPVC